MLFVAYLLFVLDVTFLYKSTYCSSLPIDHLSSWQNLQFITLLYYPVPFIEHCDHFIIYCHGEGQFGLFNEEHPTAIKKRVHEEVNWKKTEHFLGRMHWKAYHFLNPTESMTKETNGFKSRNSPPRISELITFEDGMLDLIQNIQNEKWHQEQMKSDIKNKIKKPDRL